MKYPLCRHIRTTGVQCQAPALNGGLHCFFHKRLYQRHSGFRAPAPTPHDPQSTDHIQLAPLEDAESIQVAFSVVINALATGQLEPRRASTLLYGLQMASTNITRMQNYIPQKEIVRSVTFTSEGHDVAPAGASTINIPNET